MTRVAQLSNLMRDFKRETALLGVLSQECSVRAFVATLEALIRDPELLAELDRT